MNKHVLVMVALAASAWFGGVAHADPVHHFELSMEHGCAANDCDTVWCWGGEEFVFGGDKGVVSTFSQTYPYQTGAGDRHACINWRDVLGAGGFGNRGIIDCWGRNDYGQIDVPQEHDWRQLSVGRDHICATDWTHHAVCWGRDDKNQVSDAPALQLFASVSAGVTQSCGLSRRISGGTFDGESITCWGEAAGGITHVAASDLPGAPTERFTKASAGLFHTCALTNEDRVYCWGANDASQLLPWFDGSPQGLQIPIEGGQEISQVVFGPDYVDVSAGELATCAVFRQSDGTGGVHCWGYPFNFKLALWEYVSGQQGGDVLPSSVLPIPKDFRPETAQVTYNEVCTLGHWLDGNNQPIGDAELFCYHVNYGTPEWSCDPTIDPTCTPWDLIPEVDETKCG